VPAARHRHAGLLSANHGYWGAQLVAPYVEEEIAWAIEKHEALRYFPDESVGYRYPEAYIGYFGADYNPPDYIHREHEAARRHRWYMTSRLITINDIYSFDPDVVVDFDEFEDVLGRPERSGRRPAAPRRPPRADPSRRSPLLPARWLSRDVHAGPVRRGRPIGRRGLQLLRQQG
jgi:hypothetical protein